MRRLTTKTRNHVELLSRTEFRLHYGKIKQTQLYIKYYETVMETVRQFIIEGGLIDLPYNLGQLCIVKKNRHVLKALNGEIKRRYIDWNKTYKHRREKYPTYTPEDWRKPENKNIGIILFDNSHTDNMMYTIRHRMNIIKHNPNILCWTFKPVQKFSRQLAQYLKNTKKLPNYYEYYKTVEHKFDYRDFAEKVAANNLNRQRDGYRKYLRSLEENRDSDKQSDS